MDYYQILECMPSASEQEIRKSFLKLAKKYHPDIYKGQNKEHFKKILEVYNILKNPVKRSDYDKHQKIKAMKSNKDYQDFEKKMKEEGQEFSHEMYEEMKRKASQEKTVRDKIDPEIEQAFKKLNINRLYNEFLARPIRTQPEELHENIMKPDAFKKMSKRDLARMKFVKEHRRNRKIQESIRNRIVMEMEKVKDFEDGTVQTKNKNYAELVEEINKDVRAIEEIQKPIVLYKEQKELIKEMLQKQDENLNQVKKVVYPFWALAIFVNCIFLIGYYYQNKLIEKNSKKLETIEKFKGYKFA